MASKRLLQGATTMPFAAVRQSKSSSPSVSSFIFQNRAISTTSQLRAPPRGNATTTAPSLNASVRNTTKTEPAEKKPPPPPPSPSSSSSPSSPQTLVGFNPATAASKAAASEHAYDATSDHFDLSRIIASESDDFLKTHYRKREPELRLKPVLGRTVHVTKNQDMARAVQNVNRLCAHNKIKKLVRLQKQHERPGLRRKRLASERWRARFRKGFTATVKRVQDLQSQGW